MNQFKKKNHLPTLKIDGDRLQNASQNEKAEFANIFVSSKTCSERHNSRCAQATTPFLDTILVCVSSDVTQAHQKVLKTSWWCPNESDNMLIVEINAKKKVKKHACLKQKKKNSTQQSILTSHDHTEQTKDDTMMSSVLGPDPWVTITIVLSHRVNPGWCR